MCLGSCHVAIENAVFTPVWLVQALPSHLREEIEFDAVQKPIFMSHILKALAHWQTGLQIPVGSNEG